jgi:anti-anti-sigma factor
MVMPLIGTIDSTRAQQIMETLLASLAAYGTQVVILDITGVSIIDTMVANALIEAAHAARLLGAQVMLTGIRPEVAQTLVGLGVDLRGIRTHSTLDRGIAAALRAR